MEKEAMDTNIECINMYVIQPARANATQVCYSLKIKIFKLLNLRILVLT